MGREKLTAEQKAQIVQVMKSVGQRCIGDSDEMVALNGPEVQTLLETFGHRISNQHALDLLKSSEPVFAIREDFFIESTKPQVLIRNARQIVGFTQAVFQGARQHTPRLIEQGVYG